MTATDSKRLAQIRKDLLKHEAVGVDTSGWEATFFIRLLNAKNEELRRLRKDGKSAGKA